MKPGQKIVLSNPVKIYIVYIDDREIRVGSIESQIAYKRYVSKSEKASKIQDIWRLYLTA